MKSVYTGDTVLKICVGVLYFARRPVVLHAGMYMYIQLPYSVIVAGCIFEFDTLTSEIGDGCCNLLQHFITPSLCGTLMAIEYCVHGLCCRCDVLSDMRVIMSMWEL